MTHYQALGQYQQVKLSHTPRLSGDTTVLLPASKSESNRALIINALAGQSGQLHNLSEARDTQTMQRLLQSSDSSLDVLDAGTTMRFLTAYLSITATAIELTGTERMQQRPIGILVDALRTLGATITYKKQTGYPPLQITKIKEQATRQLTVQGDVSSQYISALLMIGPVLPKGLEVTLTGTVGSKPYIDMTRSLMKRFGAESSWQGNVIIVNPTGYHQGDYAVESDWSGASYWLSIASQAPERSIKLLGLREDSLQGDKEIIRIMEYLGVNSHFDATGLVVQGGGAQQDFEYDFQHCPDLAQTVAVACALNGVRCVMTGLHSLRIKETDRIAALQQELSKLGAQLIEEGDTWTLLPPATQGYRNQTITIHTYEDHRMAMAFAPIALHTELIIEDPVVVHKSYPRYWDNLEQTGIQLSFS